MLSYRQPVIEEIWRPGIECDTFAHEQKLLEKIRYYLAHDQQRTDIAVAGQRRTLSEHPCSHRLPAILAMADDIRAARPRHTDRRATSRKTPVTECSRSLPPESLQCTSTASEPRSTPSQIAG
ncbi:MAG TPA: glycosyltransferase [Phycisphaerae bacterium]|nr:glycosyltransferase [Phycisphaerae bacterium]